MLGYDDESRAARPRDPRPGPAVAGRRRLGGAERCARPTREQQEVHIAERAVPAPRRNVLSGRVLVASGRAGGPHPRRGGDLLRHQRAADDAGRAAPGRAAHRQARRRGHRRRHHRSTATAASSSSTAPPRRLFGVAAAEAIGGPIDRFIPYRPERRREPAPRRIHDRRGGGKPPGALHELIGTRADGDEFPLEASLSRLDTDRGVLMTVVLRDVTELHLARAERQARASLEAAQSRQDRVPVAHEPRAAHAPQRRARLRPAAAPRRGAAADASSSSAASSTSRTPARTCSRSSTTSSTCRASNRGR